MIGYVTLNVNGFNGAGKSAGDVLKALSATGFPLAIYSQDPALQDKTGGTLEWFHFPWGTTIPPIDIKSKLVFVNSLVSHGLWRAVMRNNHNYQTTTSVLIVRESPDHFDDDSAELNLDWAINAVESYSYAVFVSSNCRDQWLQIASIKKTQSFYIPNCCEEEKTQHLLSEDRQHLRTLLGFPHDRFIISCVGSIQKRKGQDLLIKLLPELMAKVPQAMVYFVGPVQSGWGDLLKRETQSGSFNDRVHFLEERTDALEIIRASDLLLLPARAEAMPRVILEAMALKTPVVASNVNGIPEIVDHDAGGILFSPTRPEEMISAIERLASDSAARKTYAENSFRKYWHHFSRSKQIDRYHRLIHELMV